MYVCVCLQLPRAVGTQALSGAGFLKMINKATDAVSKMTIKMNESDVVSSAVNSLLLHHGFLRMKAVVNNHFCNEEIFIFQ